MSGATQRKPSAANTGNWWRQERESSGQPWQKIRSGASWRPQARYPVVWRGVLTVCSVTRNVMAKETAMEIDTGTTELLCSVTDGVALITLNRPEARNAMSDKLTPALRSQIKERGEDRDVGAIL